MKPIKYKEIMPRVAIENLKLISLDDLVSLINKDVESIRCALLDSPYRDNILAISKDENDSISFEAALLENYAETFRKLVKFSVGDMRDLLLTVLKKFEVANVKTMLRAAKVKMDANEAIRHIIPLGTLDKDRCRTILVRSKSVEDVINSLLDFEYGLILKGVLSKFKTTELLPFEVALDKAVYQEILESIETLKGVDKIIAKNVLGIEVDAINVKIILRCKVIGVSQNQIKDYLMPTSFIDKGALDKVIKAADVKSAINYLLSIAENFENPFYRDVFTQILRECDAPLSRLETILDKAALKTSLDMLKKYTRYYNIGFILAFLNLKWVEVKNLRCIIQGSERKAPPSQIRKLLIIPNEF